MRSFREEYGTPAGGEQMNYPLLKSIRPEDLAWNSFAAFPPAARLAVVLGQPAKPGLYIVRVKLPSGIKLMPHWHPEDRIYTVLSGTFYIRIGAAFDPNALKAYPPGSVVLLPGGTSHFHWARTGEYITQVMGIGPLGIEYLNQRDDPRRFR
jgi:quercetin dioxygenase-like cupin family protein